MSNRVAIVGATGLVGEALLRILQQRSFPISELVLLASERSAGQIIEFNEQEHEVSFLDDFDFESIDFFFFSAGADVSRVFAPKAANAGSIVIDNTSEFRYDDHIPLIIPEVNAHALKDFKKQYYCQSKLFNDTNACRTQPHTSGCKNQIDQRLHLSIDIWGWAIDA